MAVNLPGHPVGPITCHTVGDYAEALAELVHSSGLERPSLCGHSMGGAICMQYAIDHPDEVSNLILVGTGAKLGVLPAVLEGLETKPLKAVEEVVTPMSFHSLGLELAREARAALSTSNPGVFLNDYMACNRFDARESVVRIKNRTLLVCGEYDRLTPPSWTSFLASKIQGSRAVFVKDSGHMVPLEKPAELAGLIQDFLSP